MSILTDISSGAVGGLLGGIGQLARDIREAITGDLPAEKQAEFATKMAELETQVMNAQNTVNLEEAKSERVFVSGGRPFVIWVGGIAFAYSTILEPIMRFFATLYGYKGGFPVLNTDLTLQILMGLLGLGVMRSVDKKTTGSSPTRG